MGLITRGSSRTYRQKIDTQNAMEPLDFENFCAELTKLFNTEDLEEIKKCQLSVISHLEKCNKKTASCVQISKNYHERLAKQFSEYSKKMEKARKSMENIQTRIAKLEHKNNSPL